MGKQLTPRQVARAIGVSEASLKRWCDRGLIPSVRTAGGHRRLEFSAVMQFLRESGHPLPDPEVLGLPSTVRKGPMVLARATREATTALIDGDHDRLRALVFSVFVSGHSVAEIGDEIIAGAFSTLGERWRHGRLAVYEERRGCEMVLLLLHELLLSIPTPAVGAPLAIGGTLSGDPYTVPNQLVEAALRDSGWRTVNLGSGLPVETVAEAVTDLEPHLLWLSLSATTTVEVVNGGAPGLVAAVRSTGTQVVVGGRAASERVLAALPGAVGVAGLRGLPAPPAASPAGSA